MVDTETEEENLLHEIITSQGQGHGHKLPQETPAIETIFRATAATP